MYTLAIHGGAGTITKSSMSPEKELLYKAALNDALKVGESILKNGGSSLDAVVAAVVFLEDCPLFNAGRGAVFTADGVNELDASVMRGDNLMAGAVAGVKNIRNPVKLARAIMEHSEHVLLAGKGASDFARTQSIAFESDEYFHTDFRLKQLEEARLEGGTFLDHTEKKFGTVGAVALDKHGNLAACTSTGGMTNKRFGRVGDSPVIGAGTYANNQTAAISCTGHGEFFLRGVVAYDVSCLMEYAGLSLQQACEKVILEKQVKLGGEGGLIAVDAKGNISLVFNSEGMYRGKLAEGSESVVEIYKE